MTVRMKRSRRKSVVARSNPVWNMIANLSIKIDFIRQEKLDSKICIDIQLYGPNKIK